MKKILSFVLAAAMMLSLAACGGGTTSTTPSTSTPSASTPSTSTPSASTPSTPSTSTPSTPSTPAEPSTPAAPAEPKILHFTESAAGSNTTPLISSASADTSIQGYICGKLYQKVPVDGKGALIPVLAASEPVDVNGDGLVWNITVSPNAKWENGEQMNADTFIYTLKMAADPTLLLTRGSDAVAKTVVIKNAKDYYNQAASGKTVKWEDVGVKKIDEMTFQITLASKASAKMVMMHFSDSATSPLYQPLFDSCLAKDGASTTYGSTKETTISSGPFKLTNWVVGALREYEKNEYFALADMIKVDGIEQRIVADAATRQNMFDNGEIDLLALGADGLAKYGDDPRINSAVSRYTRQIEICFTNTEKPVLGDPDFRLALYYATNRTELAKLGTDEPATGLQRHAIATADGTNFRVLAEQAGYMPEGVGYNPELAKQYFDKAMKKAGLDSIELELMFTNTIGDHTSTAEYLQEAWPKIFGEDKFKLTLNGLPSAQSKEIRVAALTDPNAYELVISEWTVSASDDDPLAGLIVYTSDKSNRNAPYGPDTTPELERLWALGKSDDYVLDIDKRNQVALDMEKYILENALVIPVMYHTSWNMISDRIILAVDEYELGVGYAWSYADIAQ